MTRAFRPTSLAEAVSVLADDRLNAVPVAGCTDLMVVDLAQHRRHATVVDLLRLPELQDIRLSDDVLDIGAATTFDALRRDPNVQEHLPMLAAAAATVGGWQIQNRATLGGNIANASPAGDSLPVLLALDAQLVLHGPAGERRVAYEEVHTGYRTTCLAPGELITRVQVSLPGRGTVQRFRKVGTREALAISKVVVAFAARSVSGVLDGVRLAAGSVAATPVRLRSAEALLEGRVPDASMAAAAGAAARGAVTPIDDVRSTAGYRSFVLERVVRSLVASAEPET